MSTIQMPATGPELMQWTTDRTGERAIYEIERGRFVSYALTAVAGVRRTFQKVEDYLTKSEAESWLEPS